mmetsp:Transcript_28721/g.32831  ORF Transcript_28721/g.32831 Transcript_28721/m.32831 type:complete len:85 (-) Transcript_28721:60-314(-)
MQIILKTLFGRSYIQEVEYDTKVLDLMLMLARETRLDVLTFVLVFAGHPLDESKTLADYGIWKESTVHVVDLLMMRSMSNMKGA